MYVDDRALDPRFGEAIERIIDQRLAADGDERLGNIAVIGAHARTESCGQHDRRLRHRRLIDRSHRPCPFRPPPFRLRRRHVVGVPPAQRFQGRMRQRALQIAPYPRNMAQVLRLAVARIETREDAQHLGGALSGKRRIKLRECARLKAPIVGLPRADVAAEQQKLSASGTSTRASCNSEATSYAPGPRTASWKSSTPMRPMSCRSLSQSRFGEIGRA